MDATSMEMEQLVAAFAASVTMSGNNNLPVPVRSPAVAPPLAEHPVQMEELVAAFATTSLTMSSNDNLSAALPAPSLSDDSQESTASTDGAKDDDGEPAKGEEACVLRVRFPDGRVQCRSFRAGRPTAALYRYCRSVLAAGGARGRAFRIVRLAGGASDEVRAGSSTSLRDLGLHHTTVHVVLI